MAAPIPLGNERVAKRARPLDGPRDVRFGSAEDTLSTRTSIASRVPFGQIRRLIRQFRNERRATMRISRTLARSFRRSQRTGVLGVPHGREFSLVSP